MIWEDDVVGLQHLRMGRKAILLEGRQRLTGAATGTTNQGHSPPPTKVSAIDADRRPKGQATQGAFISPPGQTVASWERGEGLKEV